MPSSKLRQWTRRTGLAFASILLAAGNGIAAAVPPPPIGGVPCQAVVSNFLVRMPVTHRSDEIIARLLDGRDYPQAALALRSAVDRYQDAWAGYALGNLYAAGFGVHRSAAEAFHWYLWSAERGNRFAQQQVANAYLHGDGTQRDATRAAYWFRIGIAPFQLARMYYSLSQVYASGHLAPVDRGKSGYYLDKSLNELRALAKEPNGEAAYYLGLAYEHGDGVPRNRTESLGYLCRAASLQYAPAITALRRLQGHSQ
jgi:hypothetical protein